MYETAKRTVEKYNMLENGDFIVIGLSGGADSVSLFDFLCKMRNEYNITLSAVHVNHGIRGKEADEDQAFVERICRENDVPIRVVQAKVKEEARRLSMTEEEAGRHIRYEAFMEACEGKKYAKIAVAHNMNDNAETILMRLIRGTGIKGLGGIAPIRGNIIRPLIECSRDMIEKYACENSLEYKHDSTNESLLYTRNKIRLSLIPWIEDNLNKSAVRTIARQSTLIREENEYIEKLAAEEFAKCRKDNRANVLLCDKVLGLDKVIMRRVLRMSCAALLPDLHDISNVHTDMIAELLNKGTGSEIALPGGLRAVKNSDSICIYKDGEDVGAFSYDIKMDEPIYIKEIDKVITISEKKIKKKNGSLNLFTVPVKCAARDGFIVRNRIEGDRIDIEGVEGGKRIKKLFIDMKIPKNERSAIPLLVLGGEIISAGGIRVSKKYKAESGNADFYFQMWQTSGI